MINITKGFILILVARVFSLAMATIQSHYAPISNTIEQDIECKESLMYVRKTFEGRFTYQKSCLSQQQMNERIPFLNKHQKLNSWHSSFIVSTFICLICLFQSAMHIWFILSTEPPYIWISLIGFSVNHIIFCIEWMIFVSFVSSKDRYDIGAFQAVVLFSVGAVMFPR